MSNICPWTYIYIFYNIIAFCWDSNSGDPWIFNPMYPSSPSQMSETPILLKPDGQRQAKYPIWFLQVIPFSSQRFRSGSVHSSISKNHKFRYKMSTMSCYVLLNILTLKWRVLNQDYQLILIKITFACLSIFPEFKSFRTDANETTFSVVTSESTCVCVLCAFIGI